MGEEDKGFTVHDRRCVKPDAESAETKPETRSEEASAKTGARGLPPVDFSAFVFGLGQMALVHMGEMPEPQSGERLKDMEQARHTIDILDLLEQKTRNNLTAEEANLLRHLLSDLKLRYVRLSR